MRVKPGIYFADDPVFKGKKRELVAADYVYSWKRLLDPKVRSPFAWYLQGKIVGAARVLEAAGQPDEARICLAASRRLLQEGEEGNPFCRALFAHALGPLRRAQEQAQAEEAGALAQPSLQAAPQGTLVNPR